jgi:phospholipase C
MCWGENWTTEVVNTVMRSSMWRDTAIFIVWDDYGGFYDHVPPPQVDGFGFGIRVPMLLISPYAKQGYVDHTLGEFSSVLRFVEDNWGLSQLTHRDRDALNMTEGFDFSQPPRAPDPLPVRAPDCHGPQFPDAKRYQDGAEGPPPGGLTGASGIGVLASSIDLAASPRGSGGRTPRTMRPRARPSSFRTGSRSEGAGSAF